MVREVRIVVTYKELLIGKKLREPSGELKKFCSSIWVLIYNVKIEQTISLFYISIKEKNAWTDRPNFKIQFLFQLEVNQVN